MMDATYALATERAVTVGIEGIVASDEAEKSIIGITMPGLAMRARSLRTTPPWAWP